MTDTREDRIRHREHEIWIRNGAKPGQQNQHRRQAEMELKQDYPDLFDDPEEVGTTPRD